MENLVKTTTKYWLFKSMQGNRNISVDNKLLQSIKEKGIIQPILVNEKMEIVDGQHRLAVAELLNIPIPYIITKNLRIDDCLELNTTQKSWKLVDYILSLAERGNQTYMRIADLLDKYKEFGSQIIGVAINHTHGISKSEIIKDKIVVDEATYLMADKKLEYASQLVEVVKEKRHIKMNTYMIIAVIKLLAFNEIDKDRLFNKIVSLYDENSQSSSVDKSVKVIEEIYNTRARKNDYVYIYNLYERNKRK